MLSLHPLAGSVQADRERIIRAQAPAPAHRPPSLAHPAGEREPRLLAQGAAAPDRAGAGDRGLRTGQPAGSAGRV